MNIILHPPSTPPLDITSLLIRAESIAGLSLGELSQLANINVPEHFRQHKGFTGQLIELWLGATAGSTPQQDFPELGVELKTIPVDRYGKVLETTYVCFAHTKIPFGTTWQNSSVRNKLQRVLFVPILGERSIAPRDRIVGMPKLWRPNTQQEQVLQQDWEELCEMISLGNIEKINAKRGVALHIRPKAVDGKALTPATGSKGESILTRPRGFYLRKTFTQAILEC